MSLQTCGLYLSRVSILSPTARHIILLNEVDKAIVFKLHGRMISKNSSVAKILAEVRLHALVVVGIHLVGCTYYVALYRVIELRVRIRTID